MDSRWSRPCTHTLSAKQFIMGRLAPTATSSCDLCVCVCVRWDHLLSDGPFLRVKSSLYGHTESPGAARNHFHQRLHLLLGGRPKARQAVESRCNAAFPHGDARTGECHSTCPKVTAQVANPQCDARFDMASQQKENSSIRWK